jgi:hypothetical protein
MLELADDVGANWFLDLFEAAPTPEKAVRVREKTIARILKEHRIRRFDAAHVLGELRKPALVVAPGTIEAATGRIRGLIERIRLINDQLADAGRQLDRLSWTVVPCSGAREEPIPAPRRPPARPAGLATVNEGRLSPSTVPPHGTHG